MHRILPLSLAIIAAAILSVALLAGPRHTSVHAAQGDVPTPTPEAKVEPNDEQAPSLDAKINPPKYDGLAYSLDEIVRQYETGALTARAAAAAAPVKRGDAVAVTLHVEETHVQDVWAYMQANNIPAREPLDDEHFIEADVPVSLLADASQLPGVIVVKPIVPPQPAQGTVGGQGATVHGATAWHEAGYAGQGVKVGVIDAGFQSFSRLQGTELPSSVRAKCYSSRSVSSSLLSDCTASSPHGSAVTEILYETAPGASFYISRVISRGNVKSAVQWMVSQGVDAINMSVHWLWDGPGDGTSPYTNSPLRSVDASVSGGALFSVAAGNVSQSTWFGSFSDPDGDNLLDFASGDECNAVRLTSGERYVAQLRWDDTWRGATKDLDIYIYDARSLDSDPVASSEDTQSGGSRDDPLEVVFYTPSTSGSYCLTVKHHSGAVPNWVQLQSFTGEDLERRSESHALGNPAETKNSGALSVGAATWQNTHAYFSDSSRGPLPDGTIKPDIMGVGGIYTAAYGGTRHGSSFASPHLAGLAALVKQRFPSMSPSSIASYLKSNALARGGTTPNNTWGHGFARLPSLPDATLSVLTLSDIDFGTFSSDTTSYFVRVANTVSQTTVTPTLTDDDATYVINIGGVEDEDGAVSLAEGINVIAVEITASDGVTKKTYTITVSRVGKLALAYKENGTASLHTFSAAGLEQSTISWSLEGEDHNDFTIGSTGILSFASSPDYENPDDSGGNNVYEVIASAKDAASIFVDYDVTVTVTDVDEPPEITGISTIGDYPENGSGAVATYTASDPEGDTDITWSLAGPDRGDFDITGGVLTFVNVPDHESPGDSGGDNQYEVTVQATDTNGKRAELHVDVIVRNVDEPPVLTGPDTVDDFPENSAASRQVGRYTATDPEGDTVTLSLTGTGSDEFSLLRNGILTFKESPDYEERSSYSVTVRAEAGSQTVDRVVTINILNVEEPGVVTLSSAQPQEGAQFTATLQDDDGPIGTTWQWYRASSRSSSGTAITGAESQSYTPPTVDIGHYLRVVASYDDGYADGKSVAGVSANRVQEAPPVPEPPVFPAGGDYARSIRENLRAGSNVGVRVTATDGNNDRLTYSIASSDFFEIASTNGQLRTKAELDHEDREQHFVTVTATDPGGLTDTVTVTITVEDVDETPVVSGASSLDVEEDTGTGTALATYTSTDPDREGIDLALSGTDSEDFTLSSSGTLAFREVPDFEDPADSNRDNRYQVTVEAREQGDGTSIGRLNVTIRVTNLDEPVTVEADVEQPHVGQTMYLTVEDEDGSVIVREWKWERGDPNGSCGSVTTWETINGARSSRYSPTAEDRGHCIRVIIFYNDRAGTGRTAQFLTPRPVETGPFFTQDPPTYRVREATAEGRSVGRVQARHFNRGERLTYRQSGADARYFTIDNNAQLKTSATPLDYETRPDKDAVVLITAEDESGQTATITVTVTITEIDEGPEISRVGSAPGSVPENLDQTQVLARYTAVDPEGGTVSRWRTSGAGLRAARRLQP